MRQIVRRSLARGLMLGGNANDKISLSPAHGLFFCEALLEAIGHPGRFATGNDGSRYPAAPGDGADGRRGPQRKQPFCERREC